MNENREEYLDDKNRVIPSAMAEHLLLGNFITTYDDGSETIMGYDSKTGLWEPFEEKLKRNFYNLAPKGTRNDWYEVRFKIQAATYGKRPKKQPDGLIPLQNGVYEIENKNFREYSPTEFFLTKLPIFFNKDADCPKIKKFVSEIVRPRDVSTIQEFFGHLLESNYNTQKAVVALGEGANGKSTLIALIKNFLGSENCANQTLQALCNDRFATSTLYGKYANLSPDMPTKAISDTGLFKALTGGDSISAQKKGVDSFDFVNHAKLIFSANSLPRVEEDTTAYFRRYLIVDFPNRFEGANDNKNLLNELTTLEEISGAFNWALEGLDRLRAQNWSYSSQERIDQARNRYLRASDSLKCFVEDRLTISPDGFISKEELYLAYRDYCDLEKLQVATKDLVGKRLPMLINTSSSRPKFGNERVTAWSGLAFQQSDEIQSNDVIEVKKYSLAQY